MPSLLIKNGAVFDPLNKVQGDKMDIAIKDGVIVDPKELGSDAEVINAAGMVVMPGGVDLHTHIVGPKVNMGRLLRPEDHYKDVVMKTQATRSGTGFSVPSTFVTGYRFAKMGYTTVAEPAMPPLLARHVHEEFEDTPIIDKLAMPMLGNNWFVLEYIKSGQRDMLKAYIAWLLKATKGYAVKIVNPGGVENWAWGKNCDSLDSMVEYFGVTPRQVLTELAKANEEMGLPHTIHVHGNNLGHPGNGAFTRDTLDVMKGITPKAGRESTIHFTHIQFNSYGGQNWDNFCSDAPAMAEYVNANKHVTCDVGQIVFANTTTMTGDGPWEFALYHLGGTADWGAKPGMKWVNDQVEAECGSGVVPYDFRPKNPVNAAQWAIGLELFLLLKDPMRVCVTTDHPNAGPFIYYPKILRWLMFANDREDWLKEKVHSKTGTKSGLPDLKREYTLYEIAAVTRASAAKDLGLADTKGHLGIGAQGDVAIYGFAPTERDPNKVEKAFSNAAYTIKDGRIVVKNGEVVYSPIGRTLWTDATKVIKPDLMARLEADVADKWPMRYSVNLANYPVQDSFIPHPMAILPKV